ncbi:MULTISPECIES: helix-turn-helix transcriptional regulator [unclassified Streptomyces]|uniref:helix-turn-helix domain-containing protein n=1 Tax=unclassified Streptomyces TaxID=2593676 RepID=UPI00081F2482|nr:MULTISPECIES: helix-turn-helix transcriptional regulator [unclassified Streptomyces]MYZ33927.1 helix-turn-helix domain-containing protein [Streptomyces sp. SID4917]SCF62774.1 Transcriptional regulator, contains XRE-family HTH domain [Streptomyces sp. MnatMP-M17]
MNETNHSIAETLGQYLEQGRQEAGFTLRELASASGVPKSTLDRILKDQVESPPIEPVQQLARVLELDEAEAFAYIGVTPPSGLPSIAPYLRAKHGLRGQALSDAAQEIQNIINKYDGVPPDK